ncbi:protein of unknown function [Magnetospirillum sp. XM-1]|nr:protein of unknown function [Magnetospirillum sp. XM-1]
MAGRGMPAFGDARGQSDLGLLCIAAFGELNRGQICPAHGRRHPRGYPVLRRPIWVLGHSEQVLCHSA